MAYPAPVYSHSNATGTGAGATIDIGACNNPDAPPVMHITITTTATALVQGSPDAVNWFDYSGGGFTSDDARDLIVGVRFWRSYISANSGMVTTCVGTTANMSGELVGANLYSQDYSAAV